MQNFNAHDEYENQVSEPTFKKGQLGDPAFEVHQFMKNYAGAVRGGSLEEILSYYSDDIEAFDCPKIHYASEFNFPIGYQYIGEKIFANEQLATFSALVLVTGTAKRTNQKLESWFRLTCVLEKSQGYWQIAHDHLSKPYSTSDEEFELVDLAPVEQHAH